MNTKQQIVKFARFISIIQLRYSLPFITCIKFKKGNRLFVVVKYYSNVSIAGRTRVLSHDRCVENLRISKGRYVSMSIIISIIGSERSRRIIASGFIAVITVQAKTYTISRLVIR